MSIVKPLIAVPLIASNSEPVDIFQLGRRLIGESVTLALACSFSVEDVVLIDLLKGHLDQITVFAIDTGRLPEETYEVAERLVSKYDLSIDWYFPQHIAVEKLEREKGLFSFRESIANRHECCHIRKVEPLQRALENYPGWLTGIRREQSIGRSSVDPIEIDSCNDERIKINPLAYWKEQDIWAYAERQHLPINRLHHQGYPSIGCSPCTRAVDTGEHHRAGRWWWESVGHKECGLHRR